MSVATGLAGKSVLVIEDDYYQAEDARQGLEGAGAEVMGPFNDAEAAAQAIAGKQPDCAVVDLNLGNGANFNTARNLLARGVPILLITGYDADAIPEDLRSAPCLQKPVDPRRVVASVEALCS